MFLEDVSLKKNVQMNAKNQFWFLHYRCHFLVSDNVRLVIFFGFYMTKRNVKNVKNRRSQKPNRQQKENCLNSEFL